MTSIKEKCIYYCGPYRGYGGQAELHDDLFHGEVMGLEDVVTFQGRTPAELRRAFRESVDDYLKWCAERGEKPGKPFSGKFVTRIPPELHKKMTEQAQRAGKSLNQYLVDALTLLAESSPIVGLRQGKAVAPAKRKTATAVHKRRKKHA